MTGMPQLVAALHSFVGLAAVFIGIPMLPHSDMNSTQYNVEVFIGVFIGAITFTGSIAFGKLSELITGKALILPGKTFVEFDHVIFLLSIRIHV